VGVGEVGRAHASCVCVSPTALWQGTVHVRVQCQCLFVSLLEDANHHHHHLQGTVKLVSLFIHLFSHTKVQNTSHAATHTYSTTPNHSPLAVSSNVMPFFASSFRFGVCGGCHSLVAQFTLASPRPR
jgi:hypothetical protein